MLRQAARRAGRAAGARRRAGAARYSASAGVWVTGGDGAGSADDRVDAALSRVQQSMSREASRRTQAVRASFPRRASRTELRAAIEEAGDDEEAVAKLKESMGFKSYGDFLAERSLSRKKSTKTDFLSERAPSRQERLQAVKEFYDATSGAAGNKEKK